MNGSGQEKRKRDSDRLTKARQKYTERQASRPIGKCINDRLWLTETDVHTDRDRQR